MGKVRKLHGLDLNELIRLSRSIEGLSAAKKKKDEGCPEQQEKIIKNQYTSTTRI